MADGEHPRGDLGSRLPELFGKGGGVGRVPSRIRRSAEQQDGIAVERRKTRSRARRERPEKDGAGGGMPDMGGMM